MIENKRNQVIITIDTEGHKGIDPVDRLIWGHTEDDNYYGIDYIMDICDAHGIKILFFVDIAEAWDYGKDKIADVLRHIKERQHDIGVHIHPDHMADKNRLFLYEYSREEQYEIIRKCTDFYIEVLREKPIAFRAGKYGANYDTLDIVNELGYRYDFSEFYGQKWCGIEPPVTDYLVKNYRDIIEIPVTVFQSFRLGGYTRYDKIDATMKTDIFSYVLKKMAGQKGLVVSFFYHSFCLLDWREQPDKPKFNLQYKKNFEKCIDIIEKSSYYQFICLNDLQIEEWAYNEEKRPFIKLGLFRSIEYILWLIYKIRKINRKANFLFRGLFLITIMIILIIILITVL